MAYNPLILNYTLVGIARLETLVSFADEANLLEGEVAEVGVFRGGTAYLLCDACPNKQVWLFDTFNGMPPSIEGLDYHQEGAFTSDVEQVKELLSPFSHKQIVKGLFQEMNDVIKTTKFSLVHIDVDIYTSVKACLEFFYPLMVPGGVIVLDDYSARKCQGARKATDEFVLENGITTFQQTVECQAIIRKV